MTLPTERAQHRRYQKKHATTVTSPFPRLPQDAITKAVGGGKLARLVSFTKNRAASYEARIIDGTKKSVMRFDANGNAI